MKMVGKRKWRGEVVGVAWTWRGEGYGEVRCCAVDALVLY